MALSDVNSSITNDLVEFLFFGRRRARRIRRRQYPVHASESFDLINWGIITRQHSGRYAAMSTKKRTPGE
jgi:hypothetical protein